MTKKCEFVLTYFASCDILSKRLLGELRPKARICDEAGDCEQQFGNFRGVCPRPL